MMRRALVVAALCAVPVVLFAQAPTSWVAVMHTARTAILRLQVLDGEGASGGVCASVVINKRDGLVVTGAHCLPTTAAMSLTVAEHHARLVAINRILDLAVITARLPHDATEVALAQQMPPAGTPVAVLGFPLATEEPAIQQGIVSLPVEARTGMAWINADTLPGDSGGAVLDSTGALVGITHGYIFAGVAHMGLAVRLEHLREFLDHYLPPAKGKS